MGRKTDVVLYTFGYGGRSVEELASIVAEYDAVIVDVRLKPFSGQKGWSLPELKARFGEAYHWWRRLGNVNVKTGGKPKLCDAKKGLALLVQQGVIPKADAIDRLYEIALAHALVRTLGDDRVQAILDEAFSVAEEAA